MMVCVWMTMVAMIVCALMDLKVQSWAKVVIPLLILVLKYLNLQVQIVKSMKKIAQWIFALIMVFVWAVDWISLVYVPWDLGNLICSNFLLFQMIFGVFTIVEFSVKLKPMSVCLYLVKMEGHALIMRVLSLAYVFLNSLELFVRKLLINVSTS